MKALGTFQSPKWGTVTVLLGTYGKASGPMAVLLHDSDGLPLTKLSVNLPGSADLPPGCFYVKTWEENTEIAAEALACGLFHHRIDLPQAESGHVTSPVWQLVATR